MYACDSMPRERTKMSNISSNKCNTLYKTSPKLSINPYRAKYCTWNWTMPKKCTLISPQITIWIIELVVNQKKIQPTEALYYHYSQEPHKTRCKLKLCIRSKLVFPFPNICSSLNTPRAFSTVAEYFSGCKAGLTIYCRQHRSLPHQHRLHMKPLSTFKKKPQTDIFKTEAKYCFVLVILLCKWMFCRRYFKMADLLLSWPLHLHFTPVLCLVCSHCPKNESANSSSSQLSFVRAESLGTGNMSLVSLSLLGT